MLVLRICRASHSAFPLLPSSIPFTQRLPGRLTSAACRSPWPLAHASMASARPRSAPPSGRVIDFATATSPVRRGGEARGRDAPNWPQRPANRRPCGNRPSAAAAARTLPSPSPLSRSASPCPRPPSCTALVGSSSFGMLTGPHAACCATKQTPLRPQSRLRQRPAAWRPPAAAATTRTWRIWRACGVPSSAAAWTRSKRVPLAGARRWLPRCRIPSCIAD